MIGRLTLALLLAGATPAGAAEGKASWYGGHGDNTDGKTTACGEKFDPHALTAASWHFPCGTLLQVTHEGKSVIVRVNDRGPARRLHRAIDLSQGAAECVGLIHQGVAPVRIKALDLTIEYP